MEEREAGKDMYGAGSGREHESWFQSGKYILSIKMDC